MEEVLMETSFRWDQTGRYIYQWKDHLMTAHPRPPSDLTLSSVEPLNVRHKFHCITVFITIFVKADFHNWYGAVYIKPYWRFFLFTNSHWLYCKKPYWIWLHLSVHKPCIPHPPSVNPPPYILFYISTTPLWSHQSTFIKTSQTPKPSANSHCNTLTDHIFIFS